MRISEIQSIYYYITDKVSHYKRLRGGVLFCSSIPKTPSGKILRRLLREKHTKSPAQSQL